MTTRWLVDGNPGHIDTADRGLAYGDGVFETMAVRSGRISLFGFHLDRLEESIRRMGFDAPSRDSIISDASKLALDGEDCVLKVIVTRGSSGRGYRPPDNPVPCRIVGKSSLPNYPESRYLDGVRMIICSTPHSDNPALAGMKHLNRLAQVMAQQELARSNAEEGVMKSPQGEIISGTMSNIFLVKDGQLVTPELSRCGVAGVMRRATIIAAQRIGLSVLETTVTEQDLATADEVFLTNALFGMWTVSAVAQFEYDQHSVCREMMKQLGVTALSVPTAGPAWLGDISQSWV